MAGGGLTVFPFHSTPMNSAAAHALQVPRVISILIRKLLPDFLTIAYILLPLPQLQIKYIYIAVCVCKLIDR